MQGFSVVVDYYTAENFDTVKDDNKFMPVTYIKEAFKVMIIRKTLHPLLHTTPI